MNRRRLASGSCRGVRSRTIAIAYASVSGERETPGADETELYDLMPNSRLLLGSRAYAVDDYRYRHARECGPDKPIGLRWG